MTVEVALLNESGLCDTGRLFHAGVASRQLEGIPSYKTRMRRIDNRREAVEAGWCKCVRTLLSGRRRGQRVERYRLKANSLARFASGLGPRSRSEVLVEEGVGVALAPPAAADGWSLPPPL